MRKRTTIVLVLAVIGVSVWFGIRSGKPIVPGLTIERRPGDALDSLHGVVVFHNDGMRATHGRHVVDGYNVGLKYQCVEFVKRYYLEHYDHRMPNSYGNAKDFFDTTLVDGELNADRGLLQFSNPSRTRPREGDLVVYDAWAGNAFGHVAIISAVDNGEVEVIQQNTRSTRTTFDLDHTDGHWRIDHDRIAGWLRMP